jgi:hypothetical protein
MSLWSKACAYVKAHADHFLISIGVSMVVTILSNVALHYGADILRWMHVPQWVLRWFTSAS